MNTRQRLLNASKTANKVHINAETEARIKSGYSRVDPIKLAEDSGVAVMSQPLDKLLGAFIRESRSGILLNSERPIGMMHMTCAHELGHYFLGHVTTADEHIDYRDSDSVIEQEANQFAYSLMAPRWLVVQILRSKAWNKANLASPTVVYQLSLRLGISFIATCWALARLNFVSVTDAKTLCSVRPKDLKHAALPAGTDVAKNADVWVLDLHDKNWILEPRSEDRFLINLPSHATAGYLWSADQLGDEGFSISPVLVDARQQSREWPPLVGESGEDRYILSKSASVSQRKDILQIHLSETQPWARNESPTSEAVLKLKFELADTGLSEGTRQREIHQ